MNYSSSKYWKSILICLIAVLLFSSLPPITKQVVASLAPTVQLTVRYAIAILFTLPWAIKRLIEINPIECWISQAETTLAIDTSSNSNVLSLGELLNNLSKRAYSYINVINYSLLRDGLLVGALSFCIHLSVSFSVQTISANRASFLFGLCIVFVALIDLIRRQYFSYGIFLALIFSFSGNSLMFWEQSAEPLSGSCWMLGAVIFETIFLVLLEDSSVVHDAFDLSFVRLIVATTLALIFSGTELSNQLTLIQNNLVPLLYLGGVTAAVNFLLPFAVQSLSAVETALILGLEPVFGSIVSFLVLGEIFNLGGLLGSGLILSGTMLVILTPPHKINDEKSGLISEE